MLKTTKILTLTLVTSTALMASGYAITAHAAQTKAVPAHKAITEVAKFKNNPGALKAAKAKHYKKLHAAKKAKMKARIKAGKIKEEIHYNN